MAGRELEFENFCAKGLTAGAERLALVVGARRLSYADLADEIERAAGALVANGVTSGARVGIYFENCVEQIALYFACFRLGAVAVPVNPEYQRAEVVHALAHCGAHLLVAHPQMAASTVGLGSDLPDLRRTVVLTPGEDPWRYLASAAEDDPSSEQAASPRSALPIQARGSSPPAMIYYTSGSTAAPKGVTHTHRSVHANSKGRAETQALGLEDITLVGSSIAHVGASSGTLFPTLHAGGTAVVLERFNPAEYLEAIREERPTRAFLVPTLLLDVLSHCDAAAVDWSSFREFETAGDVVTEDLYRRWEALTDIPLTQFFGLTECDGYCINPPFGKQKRGSVGLPRAGAEVRIVRPDGSVAATEEGGEFVVRSDSVMRGYWDDPKETANVIRDGWLHTGDCGKKDADGFFWFLSRIKEIIIVGGLNVAPGEVETVLSDHPGVLEAAVVGAPEPRLGAQVVAFIERDPDSPEPVVERELETWAKQRLAQYKVPVRWEFVDELPRGAVGKVDRVALHGIAAKLGFSLASR